MRIISALSYLALASTAANAISIPETAALDLAERNAVSIPRSENDILSPAHALEKRKGGGGKGGGGGGGKSAPFLFPISIPIHHHVY